MAEGHYHAVGTNRVDQRDDVAAVKGTNNAFQINGGVRNSNGSMTNANLPLSPFHAHAMIVVMKMSAHVQMQEI